LKFSANSRERGGQREFAGVVRAQAQPSHGPADCSCGGEGAARKALIDDKELAAFRKLAGTYEGLDDQQLDRLLEDGGFTEICHER